VTRLLAEMPSTVEGSWEKGRHFNGVGGIVGMSLPDAPDCP